jgi:L,D-transpeptidase YcbB
MKKCNSYILGVFSVFTSVHMYGQDMKVDMNSLILANQELVSRFYDANNQKLFWLAEDGSETKKLGYYLDYVRNSFYLGLDSNKYLVGNDSAKEGELNDDLIKRDYHITDKAISLCLDIIKGPRIPSLINSDEISALYQSENEHKLLSGLNLSKTTQELTGFIESLQPKDSSYFILLDELRKNTLPFDSAKVNQLISAIQLLRWINYFHLKRFVIVNIPSASLAYIENDSVKIAMKVVVGKPSTRTPRFSAFCNEVILYPYWNVPTKIAVNEFLPIFKKNYTLVGAMNMQIVDGFGNIVDPAGLNWKSFSKSYFPYRIRQSTGCDNALGVMKFNLTSPFDVYLHDTNIKSAFESPRRFYSHGCIRVEKPLELARYFLHDRLDTTLLLSCLRNQQPTVLKLEEKVPVFVIYTCIYFGAGDKLLYYKDVYDLLKPS